MLELAGSIRLVNKSKLNRIHEATVQVLEETGIVFKSEAARDLCKKHGAKVDGEIVYISRRMLEDAVDQAPPTFKWWARNPANSIILGEEEERTHISPNNGPVYIEDLDRGRRLGSLEDLVNLYKLCQASDVCTIVGAIPVAPHDVPAVERHRIVTYELLKNADKPLIGFVAHGAQIEQMFSMVEIVMGRKGYLYSRPAIGVSVNPLSPLKYDQDACETIMTYAKYGQPVCVLSCAMSGVSAPSSLMGTMVLQNAEMLAGLVLTQLVSTGTPFIYSPSSAVPNLATAGYITGSPESNMINIVGLQLAREMYDLPCRAMAGLTDAKTVDCQSGYETMQNLFLLMLAGVHLINECLGVLDSIMTTSYEKFMIDEEMISRLLRLLQGVDSSDEALSRTVIQEVGHYGSYLMHPTTLKDCRSNWKPTVSFWGSYAQWEKKGSEDILTRANRRYKKVLEQCPETLLDPEVDRDLRSYMAQAGG